MPVAIPIPIAVPITAVVIEVVPVAIVVSVVAVVIAIAAVAETENVRDSHVLFSLSSPFGPASPRRAHLPIGGGVTWR